MNLIISEPQLADRQGYQKTDREYHFNSHASGYDNDIQNHIQDSNGFLSGCPWVHDRNTYDVKDFWLSKPNGTFTLSFHTFGKWTSSHYYKAHSIDGLIIELAFLGQWGRFNWDITEKCLYKIGDEKKVIRKWWNIF